MPYIGNDIQFGELTSQTFTGDGSTTAFTLSYTVANPTSLIVTIANVIQEPTTAYTVAGTTLTCTSAPADGDTIHVRFLGRVVDVANAAILQDSDQDTKIQVEESADEDTIRFDIAGAEDFTMTANSFNVLAGSSIDMNGTELILDADADTTITADTDDQIDIKIAGADDFQFTANDFTALSGSTISTNTIAETTADTGVTIDGLVIKDGNANLPDLKLQDKTLFALNLNLNNAAGTLKHSEYRDASNTSPGDYAGGLNNATGTITVTPTGTDSSTAMAAGMKISSASTNFMILDTDVPIPADTFLIAAIIENTCSPSEKSILCVPEIINRNVNGTTAKRFELIHKDTTGAAFALNTTNIASGKALKYQFIGMLV